MYKLESVLVNQLQDDNNAYAEAIFLLEEKYGHTHMLLQVIKVQTGKNTFRLFNMWTHHEKYLGVVQAGWNKHVIGTTSFQIHHKLLYLQKIFKEEFQNVHI